MIRSTPLELDRVNHQTRQRAAVCVFAANADLTNASQVVHIVLLNGRVRIVVNTAREDELCDS